MCAAERINISPAITHSLSLSPSSSLPLSLSLCQSLHNSRLWSSNRWSQNVLCGYILNELCECTDECVHKKKTCMCMLRKLRRIMIIFRTIHLKTTVQCIWLSPRPHSAHTQDRVKMKRYLQQNVMRATQNYLKKRCSSILLDNDDDNVDVDDGGGNDE